MAANSTGFAIAAGMGVVVLLMGYTLITAAGLVGFAAADEVNDHDAQSEMAPGGCGVTGPYPPTTAEQLNLTPAEAERVAVGDALFKGNCAQCHAVHDKVVGPALAGITLRRPLAWLIPWVQNSTKVVARGDAYAVKLFNEYQKQQMPSFSLSDKEIIAIVRYIDAEQQIIQAPVAAEDIIVE